MTFEIILLHASKILYHLSANDFLGVDRFSNVSLNIGLSSVYNWYVQSAFNIKLFDKSVVYFFVMHS